MEQVDVRAPATLGLLVFSSQYGRCAVTILHGLPHGDAIQPEINLSSPALAAPTEKHEDFIGRKVSDYKGIALVKLEEAVAATFGKVLSMSRVARRICTEMEYTRLLPGTNVVMFGRTSARFTGQIVATPTPTADLKIKPVISVGSRSTTCKGDSGSPWIVDEHTNPRVIGLHDGRLSTERFCYAVPLWPAVEQWDLHLDDPARVTL